MQRRPETISSESPPTTSADQERSIAYRTGLTLREMLSQSPLLSIEQRLDEYPVSHADFSQIRQELVLAQTLSAPLLREIWGTPEKNSLHSAVALQHASTFAIPSIVQSAHARQPERYGTDDDLRSSMNMAAMQMAWAFNLALPHNDFYQFDAMSMAATLWEHHLAYEDGGPGYDLPGIPHCVMCFAVYESMRAAEWLSECETLEESQKGECFSYVRLILRSAGFRCPDSREEMEHIACSMDALAERTPLTRELLQRLVRVKNADQDSGLTIDQYQEFLRPHSRAVFRSTLCP